MKGIKLLTIIQVLLLVSCRSEVSFDPGQILEYETNDSTGYFVVNEDGKTGTLYTNRGELIAEGYKKELSKWFDKIYLKNGTLSYTQCKFTPYENPAYQDCPPGIDYVTPRFRVKEPQNIKYAEANGFYTSYLNPTAKSDLDIFLDKIPDILFSEIAPLDLTLDIYEPEDGEDHIRPLLVMIHGGTFFYGDKAQDEYVSWCKQFAACGYVTVSVNYRLGFNEKYPIIVAAYFALQDVNAAIRYMLSHREEYNVNPDLIYLAGCSAGAITALNATFMNNGNIPPELSVVANEFGPIDAIPVSPEYNDSFVIRAVGNMWGALMSLDCLQSSQASIISFHDQNDPVVPYKGGIPYEKRITKWIQARMNLPQYKTDTFLDNAIEHIHKEAKKLINLVGSKLTENLLPIVYGSYSINAVANSIGKRTEIYSYNYNKHTIIYSDEYDKPNSLVDTIFVKMNSFFFEEMKIKNPTKIVHNSIDSPFFHIDDSNNVKDCSWSIEGGVITDVQSLTKIRALLFNDSPKHIISVKGTYRTGMAFEDSLEL